jgi:putative lipoprotein
MHRLIRLGILAVALASAQARATEADPWLGPDKALHFGASAAAAGTAYALSSLWLESRAWRLTFAGAMSLSAGIGKELWDLAEHRTPSWRDLAWDLVGQVPNLV